MTRSTPHPDNKRIVLVGHCGPDSSFLRMTIAKAVKNAAILMADDQEQLSRLIGEGVDLLLLNRVLDFGFSVELGTDLIRELRKSHPDLRIMLVTNYPEVQAEAVQLGALPGFGKREISSPKVADLLRNALA